MNRREESRQTGDAEPRLLQEHSRRTSLESSVWEDEKKTIMMKQQRPDRNETSDPEHHQKKTRGHYEVDSNFYRKMTKERPTWLELDLWRKILT